VVLDGELRSEMSVAVATTSEVVLAVAEERLAAPTPCAGFDVRGLLNHLMGVLTVAERAGRKAPEADAATLYVDRMVGDWRARFTDLAGTAGRAWAAAPAWHGETPLLGRTFAAADAGRKLLGELVVHGWDVARATGQDYEPADAVVRAAHEWYVHSLAAGRSPGAWGTEFPVPRTAPLLDRVLGLSGRDPHWRA